ncbi:MAG: SPOR domain-containing protein, partial [Opitutaceae bacterium]|nr:SPOR domain-containing protein [Opitutaceae bacterium]
KPASPTPAAPAAAPKPSTPAKRFRITLGSHRRDAIVEEVD